ncbi:hypothetical protein MTO96_040554 [Rhipicephalus appendiculatus]
MRLLEYDYTMSHTPGNKLYTADLSRKPSKEPADEDERKLEAAVHEFEELVLEQLSASNHLQNRIRTSIQSDKTLQGRHLLHYVLAKCAWAVFRPETLCRGSERNFARRQSARQR